MKGSRPCEMSRQVRLCSIVWVWWVALMPGSHSAPQFGHGSLCHDCGSPEGWVRHSDRTASLAIVPSCAREGRRSERVNGSNVPHTRVSYSRVSLCQIQETCPEGGPRRTGPDGLVRQLSAGASGFINSGDVGDDRAALSFAGSHSSGGAL